MIRNLLNSPPDSIPEEIVEKVFGSRTLRIERIISLGHASPDGFWYDQDDHEWVLLLQGEARLAIEGETLPLHLQKGDCCYLPAHQKHRVEWTCPTGPTIWLALFWEESDEETSL